MCIYCTILFNEVLMFNNIILLLLLITIIVFHLKGKRNYSLALAVIYTFCAPVLVIGERRMNSNYLLTLVMLTILAYDYIRPKRRDWPKTQISIFGSTATIVLVMMTLGYALFGTAGFTSFAVSMAGHVNIFVLTLAFVIYGSRLSSRELVSTGKAVVIVFILSQALMILYQKLFFESAYYFTWYTFAGDSHHGPLRNMIVTWLPPYFYRAFGTFYSPTILGMISLLFSVVLAVLGLRQKDRRESTKLMLAGLATAIIGGFSLTKSFMLGIIALAFYILALLFVMSRDKKKQVKRWIQVPVIIVISLSMAYFIVPEAGKPNVDYYYSFLLNPFSAFDSRYQSNTPPNSDESQSGGFQPPGEVPAPEDEGVLVDAMEVVGEHWLTGVGPVAIRGEFTGDSEVLRVVHDGGVIAVLAYVTCFAYFFIRAWKYKLVINLVAIPVLALGSLALNFLTINTGPVIMAFILLCDDVEKRGGLLTYNGKNPFVEDSPTQLSS